MGPISGEWSHTVYSCAENTPWSSNSWVQLLGTLKGGYCAKLSLSLQLYFGFKSLPPVLRKPLAAQRSRPVPREAWAMSWAQAWPSWPECRDPAGAGSPQVESCCQLSTTCVVSAWGLLIPFFSLSADAVPCFFSTSCSRWNPKSTTLS